MSISMWRWLRGSHKQISNRLVINVKRPFKLRQWAKIETLKTASRPKSDSQLSQWEFSLPTFFVCPICSHLYRSVSL